MPLYEFTCLACSQRFEALVLGPDRPACPCCGGHDLEKQISTFSVGTGGARSAGPAGAPRDAGGSCGSCGDPRGPGSCAIN